MSKATRIFNLLCACFAIGVATYVQANTTVGPGEVSAPEPCVDGHSLCSYWADIGECKKSAKYMLSNCMRSCGLCGRAKKTTTVLVTTSTPCVDGHSLCSYWAKTGECKKRAMYMLSNCMKSCGLCDKATKTTNILGCRDEKPTCLSWALSGECQKNPKYMLVSCKVSCRVCIPDPGPSKTCKDTNRNCGYWAKNNACKFYEVFMTANCPASCKKC